MHRLHLFPPMALSCQAKWAAQIWGHGAGKTYWGITVMHAHTHMHTRTGQQPDRRVLVQNNNETRWKNDIGTVPHALPQVGKRNWATTLMYKMMFEQGAHEVARNLFLKSRSAKTFTANSLRQFCPNPSEGCTLNSWKRRRKEKMSSKSDSFEYMNNLARQKIWGLLNCKYKKKKKKNALTLQTFIIHT